MSDLGSPGSPLLSPWKAHLSSSPGPLDEEAAGGGPTKQVIFSVKTGGLHATYVRDLVGVIAREKATIGVLISMDDPTQPMRTEAASAGFYESPGWGQKYPRMQLLTIQELLDGKAVQMPPQRQLSRTFKKAPKVKAKPGAEQLSLAAEDAPDYE
jgi:hypothetical protein